MDKRTFTLLALADGTEIATVSSNINGTRYLSGYYRAPGQRKWRKATLGTDTYEPEAIGWTVAAALAGNGTACEVDPLAFTNEATSDHR